MSGAKHTPGPWRVGACQEKVCTHYRDEDGSMLGSNWTRSGHAKTIVTCKHKSWMETGEETANLDLIAAAPDMLKALIETGEWLKSNPVPTWGATRMLGVVLEAIAKAEGRS